MSDQPTLKPITQYMFNFGAFVIMLGIGIFITGWWMDSLILKLIASLSFIGVGMVIYGLIRLMKIPLGEDEK